MKALTKPMTERLPVAQTPSQAGPSTSKRRRVPLWPTVLASLAVFAVVFEFLAFQLRAGHDPALGAPTAAVETKQRPNVVERRIIQRRVVHLPARTSQPATGTGTSTATASPASGIAPATAPAPTPAPAAPAPAPAPAPVTTSSS